MCPHICLGVLFNNYIVLNCSSNSALESRGQVLSHHQCLVASQQVFLKRNIFTCWKENGSGPKPHEPFAMTVILLLGFATRSIQYLDLSQTLCTFPILSPVSPFQLLKPVYCVLWDSLFISSKSLQSLNQYSKHFSYFLPLIKPGFL